MKIKIDNQIYNAEEYPIMVIFTDKDKENIANMNPDATKYACFPENTDFTEEEMLKWMEEK